MTEQLIRDTAAACRLRVEKRVTTGTDRAGFATFEIVTEPGGDLDRAYRILKDDWPAPGFVSRRLSEIDGAPYVEVQSVYFAE